MALGVNQDLFDTARWLIGAIARGLQDRGGEGVGEVLERLARQNLDETQFHEAGARRIPAVRHFAECAAEIMIGDAGLAAALAALGDQLHWRQSSAYSDAVLGEGFMDNYGWCELIGPRGFFAGNDFLLGLLLLGPGRHYKDHYHPAPELYWPLTGPSDWKKGAGGFETKAAGTIIWHPPLRMHATKTGAAPLLAVWCWTRDTETPASLAGA